MSDMQKWMEEVLESKRTLFLCFRAGYIIPAHRPEAENLCFGPVTFPMYEPNWPVKTLGVVLVIQLLHL